METPSTEPAVDQQKLAGIADRLEACAVEIVQRARDIQGQPREAPVLSTLLLLRGLSHYQALLVLAAEGFGIEMRMVVRSLLEVALCIAYLHNDPEAFAAELEADGTATQVQQAKVLMKDTQLFGNLSPESRRQLNDFIKSAAEAKPQWRASAMRRARPFEVIPSRRRPYVLGALVITRRRRFTSEPFRCMRLRSRRGMSEKMGVAETLVPSSASSTA